ncbi:SprT family zinc-dependent metalloprotease [Methanoregula sp.]|uniref:M48 family metallopeptidase n=1 Tax=Methanoregula sp. TaxID=2052170 RepID=UPI002626551A|nr:SprT family zinc-dependent metalloprotease [Methanoregula sp.]MDD5143384.1 SprT family zinc-dependent metalloprotease [Methanoregula sp.]
MQTPEIPVEKILRSRRKTIALEVTPQATLVVRAPHRLPQAYIDRMILEKSIWIKKKMAEMRARPQAPVRLYEEGEVFWFLGRAYPLHYTDDPVGAIVRTDRLEVSRTLRPDIRNALQRWYVEEAKKEIAARCMYFSMMTGYSPTSIRITNAKGRWGSCTYKGGLNFSWRLVQAPLSIVDYVIVHELVHLRQHDHSKKFWTKVEALMPDYQQRREWLRENERLLRI